MKPLKSGAATFSVRPRVADYVGRLAFVARLTAERIYDLFELSEQERELARLLGAQREQAEAERAAFVTRLQARAQNVVSLLAEKVILPPGATLSYDVDPL